MRLTATATAGGPVILESGSFLHNVTSDIRYQPKIWLFMGIGALIAAALVVRAHLEKTPSAETRIWNLVIIAFAITSAIAILQFMIGQLRLATKHVLRFAPDGIEEEIRGRRSPHGWNSLLSIEEDDGRLVILFDSVQDRFRLSMLDMRTAAPAVAQLLELCADHAAPEIARFARARLPARTAPVRATERRAPSRDLN